MKLTRRELILMAVLGLTVTVVVLYVYLWQPLLTERDALSQRRHALAQQLERLALWETKEAELQAQVAELKEQVRIASAERQLGIPLPEFLVMIEDTARAAFVNLVSTNIAISDAGVVASLHFTGTYSNLYRLLTLLEEQVNALALESVQFSGDAASLSATIQARLFSGTIIGEAKEQTVRARSPFAPR